MSDFRIAILTGTGRRTRELDGIDRKGSVLDVGDLQSSVDETIETVANVVGLARMITPIMIERGGGAFVNISSMNEIEPRSPYPMSALRGSGQREERTSMRKEYGKALRDLFAARMKAEFPHWRSVRAPKGWYWSGERVYVQDAHPVAWQVVVLQSNLKDHDAFDIEVGWSVQKRVPELGMRPCPEDPTGDEALSRDEYLCRLSGLVPEERGTLGDGWVIDPRTFSVDPEETFAALMERSVRISAEQARAAVYPLLDDAVSALGRYGIAYLEGRLPLLAARSSPPS